jgi:hypothetical protein
MQPDLTPHESLLSSYSSFQHRSRHGETRLVRFTYLYPPKCPSAGAGGAREAPKRPDHDKFYQYDVRGVGETHGACY